TLPALYLYLYDDMKYRRHYEPNKSYFFTLNLADRSSDLLLRHIDELRHAFKIVKQQHPFDIDAIVILPDHLHMLCTFDDDCDYSTRIRLIKSYFSQKPPKQNEFQQVGKKKQERGIWQRRFWEHCIKDEQDFNSHVDYIHINPVKHGLVSKVSDWQYSSFHRYVKQGILPKEWGG
ncbi:transposase, partial [Moraxella sp. Tifton1]|uniref:REP-associated tyrosine transposase n=1 Tax=Moraxella oculi TaxID=2940516 RepID=UPI002012DC63